MSRGLICNSSFGGSEVQKVDINDVFCMLHEILEAGLDDLAGEILKLSADERTEFAKAMKRYSRKRANISAEPPPIDMSKMQFLRLSRGLSYKEAAKAVQSSALVALEDSLKACGIEGVKIQELTPGQKGAIYPELLRQLERDNPPRARLDKFVVLVVEAFYGDSLESLYSKWWPGKEAGESAKRG